MNRASSCEVVALEQKHTCNAAVVLGALACNEDMLLVVRGAGCAEGAHVADGGLEMLVVTPAVVIVVAVWRQLLILQTVYLPFDSQN